MTTTSLPTKHSSPDITPDISSISVEAKPAACKRGTKPENLSLRAQNGSPTYERMCSSTHAHLGRTAGGAWNKRGIRTKL